MEQFGTIWNNMEQYGTWSSFQFRASEISGVQLGTASPHFAGFKKNQKWSKSCTNCTRSNMLKHWSLHRSFGILDRACKEPHDQWLSRSHVDALCRAHATRNLVRHPGLWHGGHEPQPSPKHTKTIQNRMHWPFREQKTSILCPDKRMRFKVKTPSR